MKPPKMKLVITWQNIEFLHEKNISLDVSSESWTYVGSLMSSLLSKTGIERPTRKSTRRMQTSTKADKDPLYCNFTKLLQFDENSRFLFLSYEEYDSDTSQNLTTLYFSQTLLAQKNISKILELV